jgi:dipeptidyl aminopeptidase/acylaminoacyl peptidase
MKKVATAILLSYSALAIGAESLTVYGHGANRQAALEDAFRTVSQNVCGVDVLDDREHFNNKTVHDKTLVYSSCRVKNYRVIKDELESNHRLLVNVTVENTSHSGRLYSHPSNKTVFDSENVSNRIQSYKQEKEKGDNLIREIFRDYPYRAFNLDGNLRPYVTDDAYRNFYLVVPYKVTWNYNFIKSMEDTFSTIGNKNSGLAHIQISAKNPKNFILGSNNYYYLDDMARLDLIKDQMSGLNELRLQVNARNTKGNRILSLCYSPEYKQGGIFYSIGVARELSIFGNDVNRGEIKIKLSIPAEVIYDISLDVVAERDCKLYASPL